MNKHFLRSYILALLLMIFAIGCSSPHAYKEPFDEGTYYIGQVLQKTNKTCTERHRMQSGGFGNAAMDKIKWLTLVFNVDRRLSKDEIRAILIDCVHEMVKNVHECEGIQKYLLPEGFNEKNVRIIISFTDQGKKIFHPEISVGSFYNGQLRFSTDSKENKYQYASKEKETYQEAIAILQSQGKLEFKEIAL